VTAQTDTSPPMAAKYAPIMNAARRPSRSISIAARGGLTVPAMKITANGSVASACVGAMWYPTRPVSVRSTLAIRTHRPDATTSRSRLRRAPRGSIGSVGIAAGGSLSLPKSLDHRRHGLSVFLL